VPRKDKKFKNLRDSEGFLLKHFAGPPKEAKSWTVKKIQSNVIGKINFISVGTKFKDQINELIKKLTLSGTNFIRCVKPNSSMADHQFSGAPCLLQLRFFGLTDVLMLMQQGFPSRTQFSNLYSAYKPILPKELKRLEPRLFFKALFHAVGMNDDDYKFGVSKVFFRAGKFAEFDDILRMDPDNLSKMIELARKWILAYRWRRAIYTALSVIKLHKKIVLRQKSALTIQRYLRGWLVRKRVGYFLRVRRELAKMTKELGGIREAYKNLPHFQSKGYANVDQAMFEINELDKRIQSKIHVLKPDDLRANFERVQANVRDVKSELGVHQEMEEERRRKELEKEIEQPVIIRRNAGSLQAAAPIIANGNGDAHKNGLGNGKSIMRDSLIDNGHSEITEAFLMKLNNMTFKEVKYHMESTESDLERRCCERELNRRFIALRDFKDIKRLSTSSRLK
ncbi:unnamed protein product, partial [Rodentolepis nana]|uniref:Myosin motor domain-containing protein n=1 Tax=Rodentolepis nana TaxID=102285 RepID=A0A0R3TLS5_RODNA